MSVFCAANARDSRRTPELNGGAVAMSAWTNC